MSDKPDDPPPRLTGSSKSYTLDGDTAEFDPSALQVHEFSSEMRQQISATKLPRYKPRAPKLEPMPAEKRRLSQRFLRVVRGAETIPLETQKEPEDQGVVRTEHVDEGAQAEAITHDIARTEHGDDDAQTEPLKRAAQISVRGPESPARSSRGVWQWGLAILCIAVGVLCFWFTRPPALDESLGTATRVHASKNAVEGGPASSAGPAQRTQDSRALPRASATEQAERQAQPPQLFSAPSAVPRAPEPQTRAVGHALPVGRSSVATREEPKRPNPSSSSTPANADSPSVFDLPLRPSAAKARRN